MAREIKRTEPTGTALSATNGDDGSSELAIDVNGKPIARILLHRGKKGEALQRPNRFLSKFRRKSKRDSEGTGQPTGSSRVEFPSGLWLTTDVNALGEARSEIGLSNGSKVQMAYTADRIASGQIAAAGSSSASTGIAASISLGGVVVSGGVSQASGFSYVVVDAEGNAHHADTFHNAELSNETVEFKHDTTKKHILNSVNQHLRESEVGIVVQNSSHNSVVLKSNDGTLITIRDDGSVSVLPSGNKGSEIQVINGQNMSFAAGGITANLSLEELQVIEKNNPLITIQSDRIINNFKDGSSIIHHSSGENILTSPPPPTGGFQ